MRNTLAKALARLTPRFAHAVPTIRGSALFRVAMVSGGVALVVAGLLVGLPAKPVAGQTLSTFAPLPPLAPQATAGRADSSLPLDVPFQVQFTKPMNESMVAAALTITPSVDVALLWDATGQVLSLAPQPHWAPYTQYVVDISAAATDQEGLSLATPVHSSFQSGAPTAGTITATRMVADRASPSTAFQITFTRPIKLSTVLMRLSINPHADVSIVGDDPTDVASQVFTLTPKQALATNTTYVVGMADGGTDSAGATLKPVAPLTVTTLQTPSVVKVTPQAGSITRDTNQPISVQFSLAMDEKSAAAALSVTANGRTVAGSTSWTSGDTILVFTPRYSFRVGAAISVRIAASARSAGGLTMAAAVSSAFSIAKPRATAIKYTTTKIPWTGGVASSSAPWHESELYYLGLMNCTRTGGWVTSAGACSTQTHHTLPARSALVFDDGIANKVARPYAKALADRGVLTHYLDGTTAHSRLAAGGYPGASWGENIASPSNSGQSGMISIEIYFQDEAWCRCAHYYNIMDPYFHRVGIGIWVSKSSRVVVDFYG